MQTTAVKKNISDDRIAAKRFGLGKKLEEPYR